MPQLRQDRFTNEWVFVATECNRNLVELLPKKPHLPRPSFDPACPFCPGNENRTGPEVFRIASAGKSGWAVRVVPDKLARVSAEVTEKPHGSVGFRIQEAVIETPDHSLDTALLPETHLATLLRALKTRYDELSRDSRIAHVTISKQQGGATQKIEHSHCRLIATESIPTPVLQRLQQARHNYGEFGKCVYCTVVKEELEAQTRIVLSSENFVALEPFASPSPFCTHIYPRRHMANFGEIVSEEIYDLAKTLRAVLARFYFGLDHPDFSCILWTAPVANSGVNYYHWGLSIVPSLAPAAEPGKSVFVNAVLPEQAAEFLRAVRVEQAIPA
jgi:UDPglucose--hexose-1-phosphate uridylyltransferase